MKRILRLLFTAAAVAGVAWWVREQMPPTAPVPAERSPYRPTPHPPTPGTPAPETPDDLTQVKGIGPVYADRLAMNGVASFAALAAADAAELAGAIDVSAGHVKEWQDQARNLE